MTHPTTPNPQQTPADTEHTAAGADAEQTAADAEHTPVGADAEQAAGDADAEHTAGAAAGPQQTAGDLETADAPNPEAGGGDGGEADAEEAAANAGVDAGATGGGVGDGVTDVDAEGRGDEDYLPPGQTEVPVGDEVVVDDATMRRALEAILMVTDEPLPVLTLARAVGRPTGDVTGALEELSAEYGEQGRGFDLREIGGGWRYYTRPEAAVYVERFVLDGQQARLTQAALETLSVVAYKQPVSRARVSAIRGVNVDGVMRTLIARGLVEEAGADTESQATLYRTTTYFLERMGMQSLDDLPELAPYLPDMDDIEDELAAQSAAPEPPAEPEEAPGPLENDLAPEPQSPPAAEADDEDDEDDDTPQPGEPVVDEAEHSQSGTAEAETSDDEDDDESEYGATAGTPQSGVSVDDGESAVAVNEELDADAEESVHDGTGATAADDWQAEVADEAAEGLADGDGSVADGSPSAVANEELDADGDHVDAADGEAGDASAGEPVRSRWYPYDRTAEEIAAEGERRE